MQVAQPGGQHRPLRDASYLSEVATATTAAGMVMMLVMMMMLVILLSIHCTIITKQVVTSKACCAISYLTSIRGHYRCVDAGVGVVVVVVVVLLVVVAG